MARIFYSTYSEDCLGRCEQMQVSDQPFTVHLVDGIFQIIGHKDVVVLNLEFFKQPSSFLVSQPPTRAENAYRLVHVLLARRRAVSRLVSIPVYFISPF